MVGVTAEAETGDRRAGHTRPQNVTPIDAESGLRQRPVDVFLRPLTADFGRALEHRRLFVLLPFAMICGLVVYAALPVEPLGWALAAGGAGVAALLLVALVRRGAIRLSLLLAAFWIGLILLPLHGFFWGTQMLPRPAYGTYEATIDEVIPGPGGQRRLLLSGFSPDPGIRRARLAAGPEPPLQAGDRIRAALRLAPVPGPVLPGGFDGQFHAYFAGIGAYGAPTGAIEKLSSANSLDLARSIDAVRSGIGARVADVLDGPVAAIAWAMIVGEQAGLTEDTREVMAGAGLAHVYSISGLHLSIVAGGLFWFARALLAAIAAAQRWPVKRLAAAVGIAAAILYLLLAGGTGNVPAFRSTLMLTLIFGAVIAGRRALTMRNVAIAAIVIVTIDPASVFRASFQLSFAAVVALIGVYELPRRSPDVAPGRLGRAVRFVGAAALTSFVAGAATLLFSVYHFQQTAPLGVIGNLLALPLLSFVIMPFAVVSVLAMPFGLESWPLHVMGWGVSRMLDVATLVTGWSAGLETHPLLRPSALLAGLFALAWFAFLPGRWRFLGPALAVPVVLAFGLDSRPDVLIADTTQAVAVRDGDSFGLIAGRSGSFAVDVWAETYGEPIAASLERGRCDSLGCVIVSAAGFSLALVKDRAAFAEDCPVHDLIVTRLEAPAGCRALTQVVDTRDLRDGGVHWLKWDSAGGRFDLRRAVESLSRPWRAAQP